MTDQPIKVQCNELLTTLNEAKKHVNQLKTERSLEQEIFTLSLDSHQHLLLKLQSQLDDKNLFRNEDYLRKAKEIVFQRITELQRMADDLKILLPRISINLPSELITNWQTQWKHLHDELIPTLLDQIQQELKYYDAKVSDGGVSAELKDAEESALQVETIIPPDDNGETHCEDHCAPEMSTILAKMVNLLQDHRQQLTRREEDKVDEINPNVYEKFLTQKMGNSVLAVVPEEVDYVLKELNVDSILTEEQAWKALEGILLAVKFTENKYLAKTISSKQLRLYTTHVGMRLQQLLQSSIVSNSSGLRSLLHLLKDANTDLSRKGGMVLFRQESMVSLTGFESTVPKIKQDIEEVITKYANGLLNSEGLESIYEERNALVLLAEKYCSRLATMTQRGKAPIEKDSEDELLESPDETEHFHRMQWKDLWISATEYSEEHHQVLVDDLQLKTSLSSLHKYALMLSNWLKVSLVDAKTEEELLLERKEIQIHQLNLLDQLRIIELLRLKTNDEASNKKHNLVRSLCLQVVRELNGRKADLTTAVSLLQEFVEISFDGNDNDLFELLSIKTHLNILKKQTVVNLPSFKFPFLQSSVNDRLKQVERIIDQTIEVKRQSELESVEEQDFGVLKEIWNIVKKIAFDLSILVKEKEASEKVNLHGFVDLSVMELKSKRRRIENFVQLLKTVKTTLLDSTSNNAFAEEMKNQLKIVTDFISIQDDLSLKQLHYIQTEENQRKEKLHVENHLIQLHRQSIINDFIQQLIVNYPEFSILLQEEINRSEKLLNTTNLGFLFEKENYVKREELKQQLIHLRNLLNQHKNLQQSVSVFRRQLTQHIQEIDQFEKNFVEYSVSSYLDVDSFYKTKTIRLAEQRLQLQKKFIDLKSTQNSSFWKPLKMLSNHCDAKMSVIKTIYQRSVDETNRKQILQNQKDAHRVDLEKSVVALRMEYQQVKTLNQLPNEYQFLQIVAKFFAQMVLLHNRLFEEKRLLYRDDVEFSYVPDDIHDLQKTVQQVHCQSKHFLRRKISAHIDSVMKDTPLLLAEWTKFCRFWSEEMLRVQSIANEDIFEDVCHKTFALNEMASIWEQYLFHYVTTCPGSFPEQAELLADWSDLKDCMEEMSNVHESKQLAYFQRELAVDQLKHSTERVKQQLNLMTIALDKPISQQKLFTVIHLADIVLRDLQQKKTIFTQWLTSDTCDKIHTNALLEWNALVVQLEEKFHYLTQIKQQIKDYSKLCIGLEEQLRIAGENLPKLQCPHTDLGEKRLVLQILNEKFFSFPDFPATLPLELAKQDRVVMKTRVNILRQSHHLFSRLLEYWNDRIQQGSHLVQSCLVSFVQLKNDLLEMIEGTDQTVSVLLDYEEGQCKMNNWLNLMKSCREFSDKSTITKLQSLQNNAVRLLQLLESIHEKKLAVREITQGKMEQSEVENIFQKLRLFA